jgi:ribulose-5-phosphate 4-epimerase/fuculose-1-phosphate aldolase
MLEELKAEVLRVSRLAEETGLCHHGGGNFSQLDRESGLVVITPHAESRYDFNAEDMLVMDLAGSVVENRKGFTPSSETPMHLCIYKARPDAGAVCHTHAHTAATFACLGVPVKPVIFEAMMYGGYCRVVPFEEPGSAALGQSAVAGLQGTYATILGKHGLISIGGNIYDAYLKTVYVEDVCDVNIRAASVAGYEKLSCLTDEQIVYFRDVLGLRA